MLFLALAALGWLLFAWRVSGSGWDFSAGLGLVLGCVFLFYSLNYRKLLVQLTDESLKLTFGMFTWTIPLDHIASAAQDDSPILVRYGGAGVHFIFARGRYRVSFNFLEYPRVVVNLKRQRGPVKAVSFTTRRPEAVLNLLQEAVASQAQAKKDL